MTQAMQAIRKRLAAEPLSLRQRLLNKRAYLTEQLKGRPLPPTGMMYLVQGSHDAVGYVEGGLRGYQTVLETLEKSYVNYYDFTRVLDFGCGCGRVLRYWKPLANRMEVHGTDYNPELVLWAGKTVPFAKVGTNQLHPPLKYPDNYFDFIYAFSTFTHWPARMQVDWLIEFARVLRPAGHLIFTVHGDYYLPKLAPDLHQVYRDGLIIHSTEHAGTNLFSAFNSYNSVINELLPGSFKLVEFYPRAARGNPWQDVYLVQKPTSRL